MNSALPFDCISFVATLALIVVVAIRWKKFSITFEAKVLISLMLVLVLYRSLSNLLEWSGITPALDPYEDYTELLIPLVWIYLLISMIQSGAKRELESQERRYRAISAMTTDFVYSLEINKDGSFGELWIGGAIEQITGYHIEEFKLFSGWDVLVHDEDKEIANASLQDALLNRRSSCDYRIIKKDGKIVWVHDARYPEYDPIEKRVVRVYGTVQDATDQYLSSQALIEIENRLNRAQAVAHVGNWEIDLSLNVMRASEESYRLYGLTSFNEDIPLGVVQNMVIPEDRPLLDSALRKLLGGEEEYNLRFRIRRANDGAIRHIHSRADLEMDSDGVPKRVIGTIQDVTELVSLEEQYFQAQKMEAIGHFAGGVAHDINNLITAIMGHTELINLQLEKEKNEETLRNLEEILKASERAAALNRRLLTFSRKHELEMKAISINAIISGLENLLKRIIGEEISLEVEYDPENPYAYVDISHLEQMIMNVIVNARDAMPTGGILRIRTLGTRVDNETAFGAAKKYSGDFALITIEDTGIGMSPEQMKHIFEPFFTTKAVGIGTGLGLATVSRLTKQLKGFVQVESTQGKGTSFRIFLPRISSVELDSKAVHGKPKSYRGDETILLIEDDETVRKLASRILRTHGYQVHDAEHADQAFALLNSLEHAPALIIADVVMPDIRGPEIVQRLRETWPQIKSLFISGYEARSNRMIPDEDWFLQKPFTVQSLTKIVREVLDS